VPRDRIELPTDVFVIGEPVSVVEIDYDGNERRGLTVKVRRGDGSEHVVTASDVVFPEGSIGAQHVAAYRRWLGLEPYPSVTPTHSRRKRQHKATGYVSGGWVTLTTPSAYSTGCSGSIRLTIRACAS